MRTTKLFLAAVAMSLSITGCDDNTETGATAVENITLEVTETTISDIETLQLKATVLPKGATDKSVSWTSENPTVADVDENGLVTPKPGANGTTKITATAKGNSEKTASCEVSVTFMGQIGFKSDKTWTVDTQVWSDVVMASRCKKEDFDGGSMPAYKVDCRKNLSEFGDLFSWEAVNQYKNMLCTDGWSVPTADDFVALDAALKELSDSGGERLVDNYTDEAIWGGQFGGSASKNAINYQRISGYYWSQTSPVQSRALCLNYGVAGYVTPQIDSDMGNGHVVRCVKNS
jgi:uncharacterized protein (TIGR02145 family)